MNLPLERDWGVSPAVTVGLPLAGIALAESVTTLTSAVSVGLVLHGLVLIGLLISGAWIAKGDAQRFFFTLALAPLIRLVSLSIPLKDVPLIYWYLWIGAPLFLSAFLVMRYTGMGFDEVGLLPVHWKFQLLFGLSGIGLGYVEYLILRPAPLISEFAWGRVGVPALILLIFTGLLEEVVFRGLMQRTFISILGPWKGVIGVAVVFALLHMGYRSALDVAFVFGVSLLFSGVALRSRSIWGTTLAHGLTNIMLFLVFPFLF